MRWSVDAVADRFDDVDRMTRRVLVVVGAALVLRLVLLGSRVAHYDEGRVAWWSMHFHNTGQFEYRYIIHGPFVQHVNRYVFGLFGASDFTMRLIVALVGALLPLSALLFRDRLRETEVIGVAFFLAFNPVLLYYSRFFRSTLLVAAFAFVAFGYFVRAYDHRSFRAFHLGIAFLALAFAAKENAIVYILCWIGGTALLIDHALFRVGGDQSGFDWAFERLDAHRERADHYRANVARYVGEIAFAVVLFLGIGLFFYAPRTPNAPRVGLWSAILDPTQFPRLLDVTLSDVLAGYDYWLGGSLEAGDEGLIARYERFFEPVKDTLLQFAPMLLLLSGVGFVVERWGRSRPRFLVLFAGYWGYVSILGYPLGSDIPNAWLAVNALVPLALPAGVGIAYVFREATDAVSDDPVRFGITAFVIFVIVGQMAFGAATGVYTNTTDRDNPMVQYAQPADDFRPAMQILRERAGDHEGTDVLFVGSEYVREVPRDEGITPRCSQIINVLPVQWYVEAYGATGDCEPNFGGAVENMSAHDPLVVIAPAELQENLEPALEGYDAEIYRLRAWGSEAVFFTRTPQAEAGG